MKRSFAKVLTVLLFASSATLLLNGCKGNTGVGANNPVFNEDDFILDGPPNYDLPHVEPHNGLFVSDHGTMTFNGDGESVTVNFDKEFAEDTGLPEGEYEAKYYFYCPAAPVGWVCEYNEAHELHFIIDEEDYTVDVGVVNGDNYSTGVNCTTADRITIFGSALDGYYDFLLTE